MRYLDVDVMSALDENVFQGQKPYPWMNPPGLVTENAFASLRDNLPDLSLFRKVFDKPRKYGQKSHDRYSLKFGDALGDTLPVPWVEFIDELRSEDYGAFLKRTLGVKHFTLSFFWFFTPAGCSVSPHCDHANKIGAHLFYLNTPEDWDPAWGGETQILIADKRIKRASAPAFSDFTGAVAAKTSGTHSLLFKRTRNSWHGVREITCPEGHMRKVFMVSIQHTNAFSKYYHLLAA